MEDIVVVVNVLGQSPLLTMILVNIQEDFSDKMSLVKYFMRRGFLITFTKHTLLTTLK